MCGILAVLGCSDDSQSKRVRVLELSRRQSSALPLGVYLFSFFFFLFFGSPLEIRLKHRGPDWSGIYQNGDFFLAHQRLAIIDPASGDQPLFNEDKSIVVTVNGEIYNHESLRESLGSHRFRTGSDCEVIAHLYEQNGENFIDMLDGMFSFVLLDTRDNSFLVARDAIGITSLYIGWGLDGGFRRWYNPPWYSEGIPSAPYDPLALRKAFENAVIKRLMTDVPFGVLLSGGLDSSLVAAVTARYLSGTKAAKQWGTQLHSFCVGLQGSPDLKAAREVADYLGTVHHEFHFTVQDGIDAIEDVIYHVETYDVTTIRASTPMFLMARKIKALGVKMVISGEGSDEIFGGYLYFHKAPNKEEFQRETCHKIKALHQYDCLRANKSSSAWGLEVRVPFLDKDFINVAMDIDPEWKMIKPDIGHIEKWVLRKAFDDEEKPYLPKHILYRQKEQFSDGVGYNWIDGLKDHANAHVTPFLSLSFSLPFSLPLSPSCVSMNMQVSDKMMANAKCIFPHNTPLTKEAYYYRMIFERFFPQNSAKLTVPGGPSVACSTAKALEWDAEWSNNPDPSGRAALGVHASAYKPQLPGNGFVGKPEPSVILNKQPKMVEVYAPSLTIRS
ncbi:Asparagine synthetase glutamine-hydrolyzing [Nymphaea thermarum]|nr:Asparagine synthetase glutamine-hydrolyzing [Nymphaea thermarum]